MGPRVAWDEAIFFSASVKFGHPSNSQTTFNQPLCYSMTILLMWCGCLLLIKNTIPVV